jgi:hypothetical protein
LQWSAFIPMPIFPEREKSKIEEIPEDISPYTIERKEFVTPVPTQFIKQVKDDQGKPLISSPSVTDTTIQLPTSQTQLVTQSKGSVSDSITWLATFWRRMIKKALHFGWKIISGSS